MGGMDGGGNSLTQTAYRFRNDDGDETSWAQGSGTGASYMAAINTAIDVEEGDTTTFRCRICCETSAESTIFRLDRSINSGSWITINKTDTCIRIGETELYGGSDTTELDIDEEMSASAWAQTIGNGCQLDDLTTISSTVTFDSGQDKRMELEMSVEIYWDRPVESGDELRIRATANGVAFGGGYDYYPTINIIDGAGADAHDTGYLTEKYKRTVGSRIYSR